MKRLAFAAILAVAFPQALAAGPAEDDYLTARAAITAGLAAAETAGKDDATIEKLDEDGRKALEKRMTALVGPLRFAGIPAAPSFSPSGLATGAMGSYEPDGLLFSTEDGATMVLVSPEPVFLSWLKARGAEEGAPAAFGQGIMDAAETDDFYTFAVGLDAAFSGYADLPVTAQPGESVAAAVGLWSQDLAGNEAPNRIVITRVAGGRVYLGSVALKASAPPLPACDAIWQGYAEKAEALRKAAEKSRKDDDPRWEEAGELELHGSDAYRECFAEKTEGQPFQAAAVEEAAALLKTIRGQ